MTYPVGTKFNLDEVSDEILRYLYWRRFDGEMVDLDNAQCELPYPFEPFEIALQKLNLEEYIKLDPSNSLMGKITPKGVVFLRTTSFMEESKKAYWQKFKERFQGVKSLLELVFGFATIILTIYSFQLSDSVQKLQNKIETLEEKIIKIESGKIEKANNSPKKDSSNIKLNL